MSDLDIEEDPFTHSEEFMEQLLCTQMDRLSGMARLETSEPKFQSHNALK